MKQNDGFDSRDGGYVWLEEMAFDENDAFLWFEGGQQLSTAYNPTMTAASFTPRQAAVAVTITGREKLFNSGQEAAIKLLASRIKIAEDTMKNKVNAAFYGDGTGSGGKEPGGLLLLVANNPTTGTVGGIDRSTTAGTFYRNYYINMSTDSDYGADLSIGNVKDVVTKVKVNTYREGDDGKGSIWLAGNSYYRIAMGACQAIQRITDPKVAKLGFENIIFEGDPFFLGGGVNFGGETLISDTQMYRINTKYLKFTYHKDCFMDPLEERFSVNQDAMVKYIALMCQFTLSNAKLQATVFNS